MKNTSASILAATGLALFFTGCAGQSHTVSPLSNANPQWKLQYNKTDMCILLKVDSDRPVQRTKLDDGWTRVDVAARRVDGEDLARIMSDCANKTKQTSTISASAPLVREKYFYFEKLPKLYHLTPSK